MRKLCGSILWLTTLIAGCGAAKPQDAAGASTDHRAAPAAEKADLELEVAAIDQATADDLEGQSLMEAMAGLDADETSMDIAADPNQRPIRVWFVQGTNGTRAVYTIGHADGACCPIISGLLEKTALEPGFQDAWLSYGVAHLAAKTSVEEGKLEQLRRDITARSTGKECAGQVILSSLGAEDAIAASSSALTAMGEKAYGRAKALSRPLMIWNQIDDHPRIVPALVPEGGAMKPLRFRVPKVDLAFPANVVSGLSMSGIGQGIASLKADIAELTRLMAVPGLLFDTQSVVLTINIRNAPREAMVEAAGKTVLESLAAWQAEKDTNPNKQAMLTRLRALRDRNTLALAQMRALPADPGPAKKITWTEVRPSPSIAAAIQKDVAELKAQLATLEAMAASPAARPELILTDALLRGWPASFSSDAAEGDFDRWVTQRQESVWEKVSRGLAARGIRLAAGTAGAPAALTLSNVVFRVTEDGGDMIVTPSFILAGPVVQVVDPDAGVVRYEASAADQNLRVLGKSRQGETP